MGKPSKRQGHYFTGKKEGVGDVVLKKSHWRKARAWGDGFSLATRPRWRFACDPPLVGPVTGESLARTLRLGL